MKPYCLESDTHQGVSLPDGEYLYAAVVRAESGQVVAYVPSPLAALVVLEALNQQAETHSPRHAA